jgi:hypothetical protein
MQGLFRPIFLAVAFGVMLWLFLKLNPDRPATYQAPPTSASNDSGETFEHQGWTAEERAVWREGVNHRLGR